MKKGWRILLITLNVPTADTIALAKELPSDET
jgi:hypothetical protein